MLQHDRPGAESGHRADGSGHGTDHEGRGLRNRQGPKLESASHHRPRLGPDAREHEERRQGDTQRYQFLLAIEPRDQWSRCDEGESEPQAAEDVDDRQSGHFGFIDPFSLNGGIAEPEFLEDSRHSKHRDHHPHEPVLPRGHISRDHRGGDDRDPGSQPPGKQHRRRPTSGALRQIGMGVLAHAPCSEGEGSSRAITSGSILPTGLTPQRICPQRQRKPASLTW